MRSEKESCEVCNWRFKWDSTKGSKKSNGVGKAPIECWNCRRWPKGLKKIGFCISDYFVLNDKGEK